MERPLGKLSSEIALKDHGEFIAVQLARRLLTGEFTLASGQKSTEYLDVRSALLQPLDLNYLALAAMKFIDSWPIPVKALAAVAVGAIPLACICSIWNLKAQPVLIVRPEAKTHGLENRIDGLSNLRPRRQVLLMEDVLTTGGSVVKAAEALRSAKIDPPIELVGVLAIVDREQGAVPMLKERLGVEVMAITTLSAVRSKASTSVS